MPIKPVRRLIQACSVIHERTGQTNTRVLKAGYYCAHRVYLENTAPYGQRMPRDIFPGFSQISQDLRKAATRALAFVTSRGWRENYFLNDYEGQ